MVEDDEFDQEYQDYVNDSKQDTCEDCNKPIWGAIHRFGRDFLLCQYHFSVTRKM